MSNFLDIIFNLGMLSAISILAGFISNSLKYRNMKEILLGFLFGTASILAMLNPLVLAPGIIFDGRSVMLSICGFFFGPVSVAIAAGMAAALRIFQSGPGVVMGVSVIIASSAIGVGFYFLRKKRCWKITSWLILGMGIAVHVVMDLLMLTLPEPYRMETIRLLALPVLIAYPATTVFIGKIIDEYTKHQQRKTRLENIIEGTNAGTWEWNVQTGEAIFNERWAEFIGYTLDELAPISVSTWLDNMHPDDLEKSDKLLRKHFNGELQYYECECRMQHKDGHWIWGLDRGKVISWTSDGKPLWMYGTLQNITEKKKAEAALKHSLEEKRVLLKELYHRTKNNMQVISSLLNLQADQEESPHLKTAFGEMNNRIRSMALVHQKLYQSKSLSYIDLSDYVNELYSGLVSSYLANTNQVVMKTQIDNIQLQMDTVIPLGLVLNELISNSMKYAFPAQQQGRISISAEKQGDKMVRLIYKDNGVGMPQTKSPENIKGLGLELVETLITHQLEGEVEMNHENGLKYIIYFRTESGYL
ncbi:MAG: histidine kinase dimerization/phosphoacceptor domain -containing protein [Spirochaetia bacterium]